MTTPTMTSPSTSQSPAPQSLKVTLKSIYDFSGKSLAVSLSYKEFELEPLESETLAEQTDNVILEFFPNIQGRWFKLAALIVSFIGIYGKKWLGYEKSRKPDIEVKAQTPMEENKPFNEVPKSSVIHRVPRNGALDIGLENN